MPIVYKVCRIFDGRYFSYGLLTNDPYCCEYALGQTTVAPIGGLFAFRRLADARLCAASSSPSVIFRCLAEEPVPRPKWTPLPQGCQDAIRWIWEHGLDHRYWVPQGTVFYRKLTPLALARGRASSK